MRTSRSTTSTSTPRRRARTSSTATGTRSTSFPYDDLVAANRSRGRSDYEYELIDTGVFDDDRYVDVDVEYAKRDPDDIEVRITVSNRSDEPGDGPPAADAVVPQHVVDGRRQGPAQRRPGR